MIMDGNLNTRTLSNTLIMQTQTRIILLFTLLFSATTHADGSAITFDALYKLYSSGMEIGESRQHIKKNGNNHYVFESNSRTTGLAKLLSNKQIIEQSEWQLVDDRLIPVEYTYKRYYGELDRIVNSKFDWNKRRVVNRINDQQLELPLHEGMLDQLLYQYAIMHDMQNGIIPTEYTVADTRKLKTYYFDKLGEEKITTPLGELDTIKLLHYKKNDEKRLVFWCSPKHRYLPVKIEITEDDGRIINVMIQSVNGLHES